ncbi:MAG TPA: hypothetical protein VH436_05940, partial [Vicinamibacterales bacterium]
MLRFAPPLVVHYTQRAFHLRGTFSEAGARVRFSSITMLAILVVAPLLALDGDPAMHDPSTVIVEHGKFYAYGTGAGLPISVSDDGWTWRRAGNVMQAVPGGRPGPDVLARGGNN